MKEFVVLNQNDEVLERASLKENLIRDGEPNTRTIEFEGNFLIGDKIVNGQIIPVESVTSERGKIKSRNETRQNTEASLREKLKRGQPLSDPEIDILLGKGV